MLKISTLLNKILINSDRLVATQNLLNVNHKLEKLRRRLSLQLNHLKLKHSIRLGQHKFIFLLLPHTRKVLICFAGRERRR